MTKLAAFLFAWCAATGFLAAQTTKVSFRTLCIQPEADLDTLFISGRKPGETKEVRLFTSISPAVEGEFSSGRAEFFIENTSDDGKISRRVVARAPLAKSPRQLFLFIPTGGKDKLPYQLICYDDDTTSFPMGHVRAINTAPVPVRYVISGHKSPEIPPGKHAQFPHSKQVNDYNMYSVVIEFKSADGNWVKGQSVSWRAVDRRRDIVITLIDPTFKQPKVRTYTDIPPWSQHQPATP